MAKKTKLGYRVSKVTENPSVPDAKFATITIYPITECSSRDELMQASRYSDTTMSYVHKQVKRASALGLEGWLETGGYDAGIDLSFQGNIERNYWYACAVSIRRFKDRTVETLSKLIKANSGSITTMEEAIAALRKLGAIEIEYDNDGSFWYPKPVTEPIEEKAVV